MISSGNVESIDSDESVAFVRSSFIRINRSSLNVLIGRLRFSFIVMKRGNYKLTLLLSCMEKLLIISTFYVHLYDKWQSHLPIIRVELFSVNSRVLSSFSLLISTSSNLTRMFDFLIQPNTPTPSEKNHEKWMIFCEHTTDITHCVTQ